MPVTFLTYFLTYRELSRIKWRADNKPCATQNHCLPGIKFFLCDPVFSPSKDLTNRVPTLTKKLAWALITKNFYPPFNFRPLQEKWHRKIGIFGDLN